MCHLCTFEPLFKIDFFQISVTVDWKNLAYFPNGFRLSFEIFRTCHLNFVFSNVHSEKNPKKFYQPLKVNIICNFDFSGKGNGAGKFCDWQKGCKLPALSQNTLTIVVAITQTEILSKLKITRP